MKLLLDTTYLLPIIGIAVKNLPTDTLGKLLRREGQVFISAITIFEISAKGAKYVASGKIPPERVARGVRAIVYSESIKIIEIHENTILNMAFKIRSLLSDFIDCLILSSAINNCDALITEDEDIHKISENKNYRELIDAKNPKFKIYRLTDIL